MNSEEKIRKQFQSKFDDFTVPPPADGWSRLEELLNNTAVAKKMIIRRRWQYAGSAAAILLLIVGGLFYMNRPMEDESPLLSDAISTAKEEIAEVEQAPRINTEATGTTLYAGRNVAGGSVASKTPDVKSVDPALMMADYVEQGDLQNEVGLDKINKDIAVPKDNYLNEETVNTKEYILTDESIIVDGDNSLLYADYNVGSGEDDYILSFGGKGGLTSFHQTVNSPMTLRSAAVSSDAPSIEESEKMLFQANNFRDNIAEMEHDQPISFGVTVSKSIAHNLSIETGLVYSYLYSRSKNTSTAVQNRQTQSLHYLGVPLNLNYNLFNIRDLNVYVSLGGMIEKDFYGKFREEGESQSLDSQNKSEILINETISQKNPQLSINTGLGLSYPIYRDIKLYGKIGGAYYFDAKNEFKTIYSDRKIVMDLSLGIRYEF
ncbi:MAG: outer membrane beta-barrel protein [Fermentimonas sp.]|nr:outer membrane beta-barrel protein [Fermentimonas sp.]